jgi:hypothetical protein
MTYQEEPGHSSASARTIICPQHSPCSSESRPVSSANNRASLSTPLEHLGCGVWVLPHGRVGGGRRLLGPPPSEKLVKFLEVTAGIEPGTSRMLIPAPSTTPLTTPVTHPSPAVNRDFGPQIGVLGISSNHSSGPGQPCSEFFCEKHPRNFF